MSPTLREALDHPLVWRGCSRAVNPDARRATSSGHPQLDQVLPGGGWPLGALTEILTAQPGLGEVSLLLPALAHCTSTGRYAVLVDPPWVPYPPAMCGHGVDLAHILLVRTGSGEESLWACEQALRGAQGGMVLAWPRGRKNGFPHLRRLQLAARARRQTAFLFRPAEVAGSASPAGLRIHLHADEQHLHVTVLKSRGGRPGTAVRIRRQHVGPAPEKWT